jgi:hypothetical protein
MARADLLALTDDALATLANRGIVKRSVREVAAGSGPTVTDVDGTVTATFADGTTVVLATGATLEQSTCSCLASGICRHRVMLAVAYREGAASEPGPEPAWSPGTISDEELEAHLGARTFAAARKAHRAGYRARVRRPTATDPVPTVELAASTVRFLVRGELGYARVDAARGTREDALALAVWAFRVADELSPDTADADVQVGGSPAMAGNGSGVEPLLPVLGELLADGVAGTGTAVATALAQARSEFDRANLRWPVDLLDDLADQLDAYRARSSRYHPALVAAIVAESIGRHRCATGRSAAHRIQVLGTEEAGDTPLRLLRLTGLGALARGDDGSRTVESYLAHADAAVVLAVRRRVEPADDGEPLSGAELGRLTTGGIRLDALARGNVVTESAVRSANRIVRITASRLARTTVTPSAGRWDTLPDGILVRDLDAEQARLAALPPAVVRARVVADSVRVVAVESVDDVHWSPGAQQLRARIKAPSGTAQVVATHTVASPAAIDALAGALGGAVRFVAGHLRRQGGGVAIEPTAVVVGAQVVVPAFADVAGHAIASTPRPVTDPLAAAVAEAVDLSADLLHRGLRRIPPSWPHRAERTAQQLRRAGLTRTAEAVTALADAVRAGAPGVLDRWADLHLRLLVTSEQL